MAAHNPAAAGLDYPEGVSVINVNVRAYSHFVSANVDGLSTEEFERLQAEHVAMMIQRTLEMALESNAGRLLPVVILNADPYLQDSIRRLKILYEGAERQPVFGEPHNNVPQIIDVVRRWIDRGGGELPEFNESIESSDGRGRPKKWTKEALRFDAMALKKAGWTWSRYQQKRSPRKLFGEEFERELKAAWDSW
jgi:hypothetical protein